MASVYFVPESVETIKKTSFNGSNYQTYYVLTAPGTTAEF
jgi:hypothetical protein